MPGPFKTVFIPVLLLYYVLTTANLDAQSRYDSLVSRELRVIDSSWASVYSQVGDRGDEPEQRLLPDLFNSAQGEMSTSQLFSKLSDESNRQLKNQTGLSFQASGARNFDPGFDIEDNLFYTTRLQSGLEYDFLKNNWVGNKARREVLKNELLLERNSMQKQELRLLILSRSQTLLHTLEVLKAKYLEQRRALLEPVGPAVEKLNFLKSINREQVLETRKRRVEVDALSALGYISEDHGSTGTLMDESQIPLYELNAKLLANAVTRLEEADSIRAANELLKINSTSTISLKGALKYNYYDLINTSSDRSFLSAGLGLTIPIPLGSGSDKKIAGLNSELYTAKWKTALLEKKSRLNLLIYEYRFKLKQAIVFDEKERQYKELLRKENVKRSFDPVSFGPFRAVEILDEYLRVKYELVELKQQLYLKLFDIAELLVLKDSLEQFLVPVDKEVQPLRSVYVWSSTVTDGNAQWLVEFIKFNDFNEVVFSPGEKNSAGLEFLKLLKEERIATALLIGRNSLLNEDVRSFLENRLKSFPDGYFSGIHLDVEPQATSEWDTKKEELLKKYLEMVRIASVFSKAKGLKLGISVPFSFPPEIITELERHVDRIYFMAYENVNSEFITKKLAERTKADKVRYALALRWKDFRDRISMEEKFEKLSLTTSVKNRAYHDLKGMITFDELILNKK